VHVTECYTDIYFVARVVSMTLTFLVTRIVSTAFCYRAAWNADAV